MRVCFGIILLGYGCNVTVLHMPAMGMSFRPEKHMPKMPQKSLLLESVKMLSVTRELL